VTVFGRANHLGMQPAFQANSASYPTRHGKWVPAKVGDAHCSAAGSKKAGWFVPYVDKRVGAILVNTCQPDEYRTHDKALYKCPL